MVTISTNIDQQDLAAKVIELQTPLAVTAGTLSASKALVVDANSAIDELTVTDLKLGASGSGVSIDATAAELNMAADNSANCEAVTTTNVITAAESGKTFFLNSATGFVSTLPAPAIGLRYRFVCTTVPTSGSHTVVPTGGTDIFQGNVMVASTVDPVVGQDTLSFDQDDADVGDWIEVISDGTSWFVRGSFTTTSGFSHAQS